MSHLRCLKVRRPQVQIVHKYRSSGAYNNWNPDASSFRSDAQEAAVTPLKAPHGSAKRCFKWQRCPCEERGCAAQDPFGSTATARRVKEFSSCGAWHPKPFLSLPCATPRQEVSATMEQRNGVACLTHNSVQMTRQRLAQASANSWKNREAIFSEKTRMLEPLRQI